MRIASLIAAQGPISVAQYMMLALLDPKDGYYATHDPLGAESDFLTAPETSQMFGEMIGLWLAQAWQDQESPKAELIELGPGRGTLMRDMLRAGKTVPGFLDAMNIVLIEASPVLEAVQRETLKGHRVDWRTHFSAGDRPLFLAANELFDALPVRQFVKTNEGWRERMVTIEGDGLAFALSPVPVTEGFLVYAPNDAAEGAVFETSPAREGLMEEIAQSIAAHGGAALIVDYGHEGGAGGETLQAVKKHQFADVLTTPGEQDISAHVDFGALKRIAENAGAKVAGPTGQGPFLEQLGITIRAEMLARSNPRDAARIKAALMRLTAPEQMGNLFRVMAVLPPGKRGLGFDR